MNYYRTLFWGTWLGLLLPAGSSTDEKPPKEMTGILGEDTTFLLENQNSFDVVLWFRNEAQVAVLRSPCKLQLLEGYKGREVTVSHDCSSLTVSGLREEDSAGYKAQMQNNDVITRQNFILKVYKHLSEADLEVVCAREILKDGNETLRLNCSVGPWEDGVEYSWTSSGQGGQVSSSGESLLLPYNPQDDDRNVTCLVKNPVGNTSRTVSLKQTCASAGEQSPRRPPTVDDPKTDAVAKNGIIVAAVGLVLLLIVAAAAAIIWKCRKNKTAAERDLIASSSSSGPNECKSLYVEIHTVAEDMEKKKPQQQKGPGAKKEVPATIYAEVQHPDKSPLQTDDEKMRREKRRAAEKNEKTIYSEIPNVKEATEENPKTIYDTVTHPRPPEASEYNKIL